MLRGPQTDLAEANRIASELMKLQAAGAIKDAGDPQAAFSLALLSGLKASFMAVHFYPITAGPGTCGGDLLGTPLPPNGWTRASLALRAARQRCRICHPCRPFRRRRSQRECRRAGGR
jgi:hypothetical protein